MWVCKRLEGVVALRVQNNSWQGFADAVGQGKDKLTALAQLDIHGEAPDEGWPPSILMKFLWLLANAPNLSLLSSHLGGALPWFPPLSQLKHVVLVFDQNTGNTGNVFAALKNLEKLETLSLEAPDMMEAPVLQLEMLSCLRAVGVYCLRPAGIHLPEECDLHIEGLKEADLSSSNWDSAVTNICALNVRDEDLTITELLPDIFRKCRNVTEVKIKVCQLGSEDGYLPLDGLSHVDILYLSGENLYLKLPAKLSWNYVSIESSGELGLTFADTESFALHVQSIGFRYATLRGSALFNLASAWAACGRPWIASSEEPGNMQNLAELGSPPESIVPYDDVDCTCKVCIDCLRKKGIAYSYT